MINEEADGGFPPEGRRLELQHQLRGSHMVPVLRQRDLEVGGGHGLQRKVNIDCDVAAKTVVSAHNFHLLI